MRVLTTAAIFLAASLPADAGHRHHHHHHHHHHHRHYAQQRHLHSAHRAHRAAVQPRKKSETRAARWRPASAGTVIRGGGMVTAQTAAGQIRVAAHLANRFQALIADFVAAGYRPKRIGCLAHGGHVPNSRHYAGAACDFDQRGWGLTAPFMYRARAIIARHGFRDGCSFNDCGHVDDGLPVRRARGRWNSSQG